MTYENLQFKRLTVLRIVLTIALLIITGAIVKAHPDGDGKRATQRQAPAVLATTVFMQQDANTQYYDDSCVYYTKTLTA